MRILLLIGIIIWAFDAGVNYGLTKQARALEGCEVIATQVTHDVATAEQKAQECDDLLNNLGALGEGLQQE